jgi:PLP dependent protein
MIDVPIDAQAIAHRLEVIQERIVKACQRAGRRPDEVTLVGVTKTFPVELVAAAHEVGIRDFGENRVQELSRKAGAIPGRVLGGDVCWHMIGHLQRNKAKEVVAYADMFHALDSLRLAEALNTRAALVGRVLPCLVQVNVSGEASKFGLPPGDAFDMMDRLAMYEHVRVVGLMTLAAPTPDPEAVRPQFRLLRDVYDTYDQPEHAHVQMQYLSMGMSGDFEVAIEEGATHVRVGTALFGLRPR